MAHKEITVKEFAQELRTRLQTNKSVDCCKEELLNLAKLAEDKMANEKILVNWKE